FQAQQRASLRAVPQLSRALVLSSRAPSVMPSLHFVIPSETVYLPWAEGSRRSHLKDMATGSFDSAALRMTAASDLELSILAAVVVLGLVTELRRELGVAGVNPGNIARQQRIVALPIGGNRPEQNLEQPRDVTRAGATH